jgi:7-cyano-7-deazaguanine synthase
MAEALVLLSGGIDSAVCTFEAVRSLGTSGLTAVTFDWGQLAFEEEHRAAQALAAAIGISPPRVVRIQFPYSGPLTDEKAEIPLDRTVDRIQADGGRSPTFFPARNLVMLAYAYGLAAVQELGTIYFGTNASDSAGFPDCRPDFVAAAESAGNLALGGPRIKLVTPLIHMSKQKIVLMGQELGVPWELTFSCYVPVGGKACGRCDSCVLRSDAFAKAGLGPDR